MIRQFTKGKAEPLSDHFSSTEFDCKCIRDDCKVTYIDSALIAYLERKRAVWGKPIHLDSGFRCTYHNRSIGGAPGSRHLIGQAADIVVEGMTPDQVANDCPDAGGLGRYPPTATRAGWTHVDVRLGRSRWTG